MTITDSVKTLANRIETALHVRAGRHVHGLDVILLDHGLVLRGFASTYYAKQMAQHVAVRVSGLSVVANEIEVN